MGKKERDNWIKENSIKAEIPKTYNEILQEYIDKVVKENISLKKFGNKQRADETRI